MTDDVRIRAATVPELPDVLNVLDGGALQSDSGRVRSAIDRGDALVAVAGDSEGGPERVAATERVLGALVLNGDAITAIAVRRRRRGQGIGSRLVETALRRRTRLVAEFDPRVRPFWEAVGFDVEPTSPSVSRGGDDTETRRLRGVIEES